MSNTKKSLKKLNIRLKSMSNTKNSLKKLNIRLKFMTNTDNSFNRFQIKSMTNIFLLDHQNIFLLNYASCSTLNIFLLGDHIHVLVSSWLTISDCPFRSFTSARQSERSMMCSVAYGDSRK